MNMNAEKLRERIKALQDERANFQMFAPVRADERLRMMVAQLENEIALQIGSYTQRIQDLQDLLEMIEDESKPGAV